MNVTQQHCEDALRKNQPWLLATPGVTGVGVGLQRTSQGRLVLPYKYCLTIYVRDEAYAQRIPITVPTSEGVNVPTCIIVTGVITAY